MANDPIIQMASDPDFAKMEVGEQRKALAAHDPLFGKLDDDGISNFVSAHQTQAQFPESAGLSYAQNQASQNIRRAIPTMAQEQTEHYTGQSEFDPSFSPYTQSGQRKAAQAARSNEYMRQSGELGMQTAAGMATGGLFPAIKGAGIAKNILPFLGRTATSAAAMGAGTALGGGTPQEAKGAALGGAVGQPISEGISAALPWMAGALKNTAVKQFGRALAPTTKINKAITQEIAPQMIQRGTYGSLEGIEQGAAKQISDLNPQLNSAYGQAQGAGKIAGAGDQVINDLESLKQSYMPEGNVAQPQAVNAIEGVQNIVKQYGSDVSPNSLRRLRQIFEEAPAERGAYAGTDLSTNYTLHAQQAAADSIRGILNSNPNIGALNKEVSFWLDVQRVTSQSALRRTGQEGGLLKVLSPLGGATAGAITGVQFGPQVGLETAAAGALTTTAYQIIRSPAWRTMSAVAKDRLASALASGNLAAVSELATRVGAANLQSRQSVQPPNQPQRTQLPFLPQGRGIQ